MYPSSDTATYQSGGIAELASRVDSLAPHLVRYAMVIVMLWFGGLKFTSYEAEAIQGLVSNSPFLGWLYAAFSVTVVSYLIGAVEIAAGLLIAARAFSAKLGVLGGLLTSGIFFSSP